MDLVQVKHASISTSVPVLLKTTFPSCDGALVTNGRDRTEAASQKRFRRLEECFRSSALGCLESEKRLAFLLQVQPVPGNEAQIFRIGAEEPFLAFMPLQNRFTFSQLGF